MIGKVVLAVLLTTAMLTTAGCAFFTNPGDTGDAYTGPDEPGGGLPGGSSGDGGSDSNGSGDDIPDDTFSGDPLAYFGRTMEEISKALGEPNEQGYFEGAEYFSYHDQGIALFFWAKPEEDTLVRSIYLSTGAETAGIKVGMSFAEIKGILGAPLFEGYSDYEESYSLVCDYGEYRLFFTADSLDGPTTSVRIKYIIES